MLPLPEVSAFSCFLTCLPALHSLHRKPCTSLLCSHKIIKGNMIVFFCSGGVYARVRVCASARSRTRLWAWKALSYRYFYNLKQLQLSAQRQAVTSWFMCTVYVYAKGKGGRRGRWGEEGGGGRSLGICFPGDRKEVVSIKNTNNEIALTVIPFSLTRICWGKENKSSSFYEARDRI